VTVGDEILLGETVDTNAAWLGKELARCGIPVVRRSAVADVDADIRRAVAEGVNDADVVLVSGGLGPTPDDLTRDSVAALLGRPLHVDGTLLEALRARFRDRGHGELPATNVSQAMVPEGARTLPNSRGTAPGLAMEAEGSLIVLLPGVPRELRAIFAEGVEPLLRERFGDRLVPVRLRYIHTTGIAESRLAELVADHLPEDTGPVSLAFLPDLRGVELRLTARGVSREEADLWFRRLEEALEPAVGPWRFEAPEGDLVEAVSEALRARRLTLAVAESCTGGLIAKRLTDRPGASDILQGGIVAYANEAKMRHLGVDDATLEAHGAVSEPVALAMATGVAERFGADAGIGVTGLAGPDGGTAEKPVGTVWYAVALGGVAVARKERFPGDREAVRERAAQAALSLLLSRLSER
jgi:nicotinamide-nucleotide amidase